jgi:hypothetical protein
MAENGNARTGRGKNNLATRKARVGAACKNAAKQCSAACGECGSYACAACLEGASVTGKCLLSKTANACSYVSEKFRDWAGKEKVPAPAPEPPRSRRAGSPAAAARGRWNVPPYRAPQPYPGVQPHLRRENLRGEGANGEENELPAPRRPPSPSPAFARRFARESPYGTGMGAAAAAAASPSPAFARPFARESPYGTGMGAAAGASSASPDFDRTFARESLYGNGIRRRGAAAGASSAAAELPRASAGWGRMNLNSESSEDEEEATAARIREQIRRREEATAAAAAAATAARLAELEAEAASAAAAGVSANQQATLNTIRSQNLYTRLGIERTANRKQLIAAYRGKALKSHPNKGGIPGLQQLIEETRTLQDEDLREAYNYGLTMGGHTLGMTAIQSIEALRAARGEDSAIQKNQIVKTYQEAVAAAAGGFGPGGFGAGRSRWGGSRKRRTTRKHRTQKTSKRKSK